jgi:hypothetical protein
MNVVEQLFQHKGIPRVGTTLYSKDVAIEFLVECRKHEIPVLGIDALLISGDTTQPSMENSIDFTLAPFPPFQEIDNVWDLAIDFLKGRNEKYYFEIVCES